MKDLRIYISEQVEKPVPQKVNVVIGRFQPFTKGHLKCVEWAYNEIGVPSVICMVDTKKADSRHPFLTKDLLPMMDSMTKDQGNHIVGVLTVRSADIVALVEACRSFGYEPVSWSCGTDRVEPYRKMATRYAEDLGLDDSFRVVEIPRTDEDISASKVRGAIKDDDYEGYADMMPKEWRKRSVFGKLRKMIAAVQ